MIIKKIIDRTILLSLFFCSNIIKSDCLFKVDKKYFSKDISIFENDTLVGNIKVDHFLYFSVLYDFFINPQFRSKGYGQKLLEYSCNLLKSNGIKFIFVQPGPFELDQNFNELQLSDNEKINKLYKLVKLYSKVGFTKVNYCLSKLTAMLYRVFSISEDSQFLMFQIN